MRLAATAIVYLANNTPRDIDNLKISLRRLYENWTFRCWEPVIIFHEGLSANTQLVLRGIGPDVYFEKVNFQVPSWVDPSRVSPNYFGTVGYRHMCRFFAGDFLRHPALQSFDYVWRLDTDSFLLQPLLYNPFERLLETGSVYGYLTTLADQPGVTTGLWAATERYARLKGLSLKLTEGQWGRNCYYTNFEILDLQFFRSSAYLDYFDFLDREGGIYYYRWGDHVIRYLGLAMLASEEKIYRFADIGYQHQHFVQ